MRHRIMLPFARVAVLAIVLVVAQGSLLEASPPQQAQAANLIDINSGADQLGGAILTRDPHGVSLQVSTSDVDPGAAYTTWWVVFNSPRACATSPCSPDDLGVPEVGGSVLWATGFIADFDGTANANARLERGKAPGQVWFGPGLKNVKGAEIHIVLRTHGGPIFGDVADQLSRFNGGCTADGGFPDVDGDACFDQQAAIFLGQ